MHLLIVHQNFVDHQHPGGTRHLELARHLVRSGHQCTIVAGSVDFLTGRPLSRQPQTVDGVRIRRAYAFPTLHHSYVGRALSYMCFMVTCIWESLRVGPVDVVLGTSPPIFQLPSAWLVAVIRRCPFVLEIRDLWPDFAIEMGVLRNRLLIYVARTVERYFYRSATWVVANSPGFRSHLVSNGVPTNRLTVIPNGVETSMFDPERRGSSFRQQWGLQDRFVVTYAGALGRANDLDTVLDAAECLKAEPQVRFLLVGGGKELTRLQEEVKSRHLTNIVFGGHVPKDRMAEVLAASDVCLAILQDLAMFRTTFPNKVFDYMAAGRPSIVAIDGVIREVIESADGGQFVKPGEAQALADTVLQYARDPQLCARQGQSARRYVQQHFERSNQATILESVLKRVTEPSPNRSLYRRYVKRAIDLVLATVALLVLSPVLFIVALLVRCQLGAPVIFRQERAGLHGRVFTLYKFRTMLDAVDASGQPLPDEVRLTEFGRRLRSLSLDELPQLFNIIRGDMSLIGPRPLLTRYLPRYSPEQARRHEVRPGVTGLAQVSGRNAIGWDERFRLDVRYVDRCSWWLDIRILLRTFACVLQRRGVSSSEHATMPEFMGSDADPSAHKPAGSV